MAAKQLIGAQSGIASTFFERITFIVITSSLVFLLSILWWGLQRGFDIMDEGFYLVLAQAPTQFPALSSFHHLLSVIPEMTSCRVIDFRIAQVISQLIASLVLSVAYMMWMQRLRIVDKKLLFAAGILFSCIGNLLVFAKYPFSLSYNSLTGMFLFAATGLIFIGALANDIFVQRLIVFVAGFIAGWCLFVKFTSFGLYVPCALILIPCIGYKNAFRAVIFFLLGAAFSLGCFVCAFGLRAVISTESIYAFDYLISNPTLHSSLLQAYGKSFVDMVLHCQLVIIVIVSLCALYAIFSATRLKALPSVTRQVFNSLAVVLVSVFLYWLTIFGYLKHDLYTAHVFYFFQLGIVLLIVARSFQTSAHLMRQTKLTLFCLVNLTIIILPLICAFGTSNPLLYQGTIYLSATFLSVFGLSALLSKWTNNPLILPLSMTVTTAFAVFQFYDGFVRHPYALGDSLTHDTTPVNLRNLRGLKVSPAMSNFLTELDSKMRKNGYQAGDLILGFYNMPGLVYALDGRSQRLGWFSSFAGYEKFNVHFLSQLELAPGQRVFLLTGWNLPKSLIEGLSRVGVHYPNDFEKVGQLKSPWQIGLLDGKPDPNYLDGTINILVRKRSNCIDGDAGLDSVQHL